MFSGRAGVNGVIAIIVKADDLWPHELLTIGLAAGPRAQAPVAIMSPFGTSDRPRR